MNIISECVYIEKETFSLIRNLIYDTFFSYEKLFSFGKERVLSSVESILVYSLSERPEQLLFGRREFYFTFSREASKERILSFGIKGCFYFKMTARNLRTLKLIWEMVEPLTVCTLGYIRFDFKKLLF